VLKSELIENLLNIPYDGPIELLIQDTINGEYWNIISDDIISIEDDDNKILIRAQG
jgi:hypothetical protein